MSPVTYQKSNKKQGPSLYTECYHWPLTLLAPFKKQDILALLRYYQNVLDLIFTTESLETRQIYIDFWRIKFAEYRAYPSLFTKEPLRLAIQKHHLPIEVLELFLEAAETSFLIKEFDSKVDLDDEIESMVHLTAEPLCRLICMILDPSESVDGDFCHSFGEGILKLSLIHHYPDMIEKQEIYNDLFQARLFLSRQENSKLRLLMAIIDLSIHALKQKKFLQSISRIPFFNQVKQISTLMLSPKT